MFKYAAAIVAAWLFFAIPGFCQDYRFDGSFNGGPIFTKQTTSNGVTQGATIGANFFGTIRYRFRPKHSLIFNYGRAKDSQTFQAGENFHVLSTISEFSGAYMYSPFRKGKWDTFVLAGAAALRFSPNSTWVFFPELPNNIPNNVEVSVGATTQTKPAFLYGFGVDYQLPVIPRLALRLQYRGLLYREPDFNVTTGNGGTLSFFTGAYGHMAEPSVGVVFRF